MLSLLRRMLMRTHQRRVDFGRLSVGGERHAIHIRVPDHERLTSAEMAELGKHGVGVRHWWLRHSEHGFAEANLPKGDQPVDRTLELPPGRYTLGAGRGEASRRIRFTVADDGSVTLHAGQATITAG